MSTVNADQPATLRELVQRAMDQAGVTSGRALDEAIVRHLGEEHRVSHTIINAIRNGAYRSEPKPATVRTLAAMAHVPDRVAFQAAGIPLLEPFDLPDSADELTGDQREAVLAVVRAFAKANRQTEPVPTPRRQLRAADSRRTQSEPARKGDRRRT